MKYESLNLSYEKLHIHKSTKFNTKQIMESNDDSTESQILLHSPPTTATHRKLALTHLIFFIFFEVSGGPYGEEPTVAAAGPLLAILGFLIFPFIWSIPEALITAELATAFPGNGGFVIWADQAFGPFWGSLMGSWKFFTGVLNLCSYPALCVDYLKLAFPIFADGFPRYIAIVVSTLLLSFLNYTGLVIVGFTAVILGVISLSPFLVLTLISIPKIDPSRWVNLGVGKKDWNLYLNTLFWNLNFWDSASTVAGEVEQPQKTYPKALILAGLVTILGYILPLLAAIGAVELNQQDWTNGYFANVAEIIGGKWLKIWVEIGACFSIIGLFEAQLSSCAYQVLGMAELGYLPLFFGVRSKWFKTPWVGILISTAIGLAGSVMDFTTIISSVNFLFCLGMLLEFGSFLWLRKKLPNIKRPFRVPIGFNGLVITCLIPSGFLIYVMAVATKTVYLVSAIVTLFAIFWYFFINFCKSKTWVHFNNFGPQLGNED